MWPYKNVEQKILCEQYMEDEDDELKNYKFFCFDGIPKFFKLDFNRFVEHHANYYNLNWTLLEFGETDLLPLPNKIIDKPQDYDKMIEIASHLSKNIPFLRVDLYSIRGKIYFGELTFYPASGLGNFSPLCWNNKIGNFIK